MELMQAIIGLVVALGVLITAVATAVNLSARQNRDTFSLVKVELNEEKKRVKELLQRVSDLEVMLETRKGDLLVAQERISELEKQLGVMCAQVENMQAHLDRTEEEARNKDLEIESLKKQNADLFESNKVYAGRITSYERVFSLMQHPDDLKASEKPEPGESLPENELEPEEA